MPAFRAAVYFTVLAAFSAQAPEEAKPRITRNLVQVDAVVTDDRGRHVTDLGAGDFEVLQDGKPQRVTQFKFVRTGLEVHRTVAVIVDDLGLSFESVVRIRRALTRFIDQQVRPGDQVAIIRTSGDVGSLQQFTSDRGRMQAAAEDLRWYARSRTGICSNEPRRRCHPQFLFGVETEIGVASALETLQRINSVVEGLAGLPGRKNVLLFSEYVALASDSEVVRYAPLVERAHQRVLDAAIRAPAVIYSIDPRELPIRGYMGPVGPKSSSGVFFDAQAGMRRLAEATGGQFLFDIGDLDALLRIAMKDQEGYYLLGYQPDSSAFDAGSGQPEFHKIAVRVSQRGLKVRSHAGFEGVENRGKTAPPSGPEAAMFAALASPFAGGDIDVRISSIFSNTSEQGSFITSTVYVKPGGLTLRGQGQGRVAEADIVRLVIDENSTVVDQTATAFDTKLSGAEYDRVMKDGSQYTLRVPVKRAGPYEVRIAVRDKTTGKIGVASQFVDVPELQPEVVSLSGIAMQALTTVSGAHSPGGDPGLSGGSAMRVFHAGESVTYSYQLLNPKLDQVTRRPKVDVEVRLYRGGNELRSRAGTLVEAGNDPTRLAGVGSFKIGHNMPPGDYALQVVATDQLVNVLLGKWYGYGRATAAQYVDFRVAP